MCVCVFVHTDVSVIVWVQHSRRLGLWPRQLQRRFDAAEEEQKETCHMEVWEAF